MTQHPSLKLKGIGTAHRSVLKRFERILKLQKEEKWKEGDTIFGLPKVKTLRLKIKKEKPAAAPEAAAAAGAVAEGAAGAVPGAPAKEAPSIEKAPKAQIGPAEKAKEAKAGKETKPGKEPKAGHESGKKPAEKK